MSLISTYQGRKSLFAEKLISKGVSASGTDGLTTLINKIDDIQHFDSGLTLYADKSIAQSSDTVNLYALLLNNGKPVSGETVTFTCDAPLVTAQITSASVELYDDYFVTSTKTGSSWDYIGTGASGFVQFNSTKLNTYTSGFGTEVTHNGYIHIKDGVLTYKDTNGDAHTIDVSSIDTTKSYGSVSFTIKYYWLEGTTGSDGVASAQYTCTGAGLKTITAESGTLQSEPYPVLDCAFTDMINSVSNVKWWNAYGNIGVTTDGDVKVLTTNGTSCQYRPATEQTTDSTKVVTFAPSLVCELEVTEITGNWVLQTYDGSVNQNPYITATGKYKIVYDGSTVKYYKDNSDSPFSQKSGFTGLNVNLGLQCWSSGQTLKYKNFKVYPI